MNATKNKPGTKNRTAANKPKLKDPQSSSKKKSTKPRPRSAENNVAVVTYIDSTIIDDQFLSHSGSNYLYQSSFTDDESSAWIQPECYSAMPFRKGQHSSVVFDLDEEQDYEEQDYEDPYIYRRWHNFEDKEEPQYQKCRRPNSQPPRRPKLHHFKASHYKIVTPTAARSDPIQLYRDYRRVKPSPARSDRNESSSEYDSDVNINIYRSSVADRERRSRPRIGLSPVAMCR